MSGIFGLISTIFDVLFAVVGIKKRNLETKQKEANLQNWAKNLKNEHKKLIRDKYQGEK